jgi:hypothetical protein
MSQSVLDQIHIQSLIHTLIIRQSPIWQFIESYLESFS